MPYLEDLTEFSDRHGGGPVTTKDDDNNRLLLLPDGASAWQSRWGAWQTAEPPVGEGPRLRAVRRYLSHKLTVAEVAFDKCKSVLTGRAGNYGLAPSFTWNEDDLGPGPPEQWPGMPSKEMLLALKALAAERREAVAEIDRQIAALPEVVAEREAAEAWAAEQERRRRQEDDALREWMGIQLVDEQDPEPSTLTKQE